jgi:hypothetical protein
MRILQILNITGLVMMDSFQYTATDWYWASTTELVLVQPTRVVYLGSDVQATRIIGLML